LKQAQVAINAWLREYNHNRPHHALDMRPSSRNLSREIQN
ncbi:integrase core domain-containing protein, partial [Pacificibacter marinus]|nr:transposase [Pacificibacter marinus]